MRFRTKPTEVEAVRWDPSGINKAGNAVRWLLERNKHFEVRSDGGLIVYNDKDLMTVVNPSSWIVEDDGILTTYDEDEMNENFTEVNE